MPDVSERLIVHYPDHDASHYFAAFIAEHQVDDGSLRLRLGIPISYPHPTYSVTPLTDGEGQSPEFAGFRMHLEAHRTRNVSFRG